MTWLNPGFAAVPTEPSMERNSSLRDVAIQLEATFLAEMLKSAGLGESQGGFNGGIGEDQFSSFLNQAYAQRLAEIGGVGLSDAIFESLLERSNET